MLQHIPFPALPAPPSWYPGHMTQFTRMLPALLRRTDVVLELRDARLPLTSINRNFEGASVGHSRARVDWVPWAGRNRGVYVCGALGPLLSEMMSGGDGLRIQSWRRLLQ